MSGAFAVFRRLTHTTLQARLLINEQVDKAPEGDPSRPHLVQNQKFLGEMPEAVKLCLEGGMNESMNGSPGKIKTSRAQAEKVHVRPTLM